MSNYDFHDILYGKISLPSWILPFIRTPEFARLRGVRLSNVDSFQFKDFDGATRWSHCIAVAWLAHRCALDRGLDLEHQLILVLAGLFHDIATPPFAHTMEYLLDFFDHETQGQHLLLGHEDAIGAPYRPLYLGRMGKFLERVQELEKNMGVSKLGERIAEAAVGEGELGFLVAGTLDLDNADNVTRALHFMGEAVDRRLPVRLASWLATQNAAPSPSQILENSDASQWREYRTMLYSNFFRASDEELGREAFLQHMLRRALLAGLPPSALVWNTENAVLDAIAQVEDADRHPKWNSLGELVVRYQLLEPPVLLASMELHGDSARRAAEPAFAKELEAQLATERFEPFILIQRRRSGGKKQAGQLLPAADGVVRAYGLSTSFQPKRPLEKLAATVKRLLASPPSSTPLDASALQRLRAMPGWEFPDTRNQSFHPYPSTWVSALPSNLIRCLHLDGAQLWDPFCGTGETGFAAARAGCSITLSDINWVALLVARARFTFYPESSFERLQDWAASLVCHDEEPLDVQDAGRWHHPDTHRQLTSILRSIERHQNVTEATFLKACFSAILPLTTARSGKGHGHFADNTPLPNGCDSPPKKDALRLFRDRVNRNIRVQRVMYGQLHRRGQDPQAAMARIRVLPHDATRSQYGEEWERPAAVITSPPYLCMSDYSLGQRLSYYWLKPAELSKNHERELGSRRSRFRKSALAEYLEGMDNFAQHVSQALDKHGVLAMVLGQPTAKNFRDVDVLGAIDEQCERAGLKRVWGTTRRISWHRNHGIQRLREERITVYERARD